MNQFSHFVQQIPDDVYRDVEVYMGTQIVGTILRELESNISKKRLECRPEIIMSKMQRTLYIHFLFQHIHRRYMS